MEMVYPVVALIFGICISISLYGNFFPSIMRLRLFSERWIGLSIYICNTDAEINMSLEIFACFLLLFCSFCFFKNILINNFYWVNPVTSCLTAVVAIGIGIGFCFFYFQRDNFYHNRLRLYLEFTNTRLDCFYDLFICFMCFICEKFGFLFCFYFFKLCKLVWKGVLNR